MKAKREEMQIRCVSIKWLELTNYTSLVLVTLNYPQHSLDHKLLDKCVSISQFCAFTLLNHLEWAWKLFLQMRWLYSNPAVFLSPFLLQNVHVDRKVDGNPSNESYEWIKKITSVSSCLVCPCIHRWQIKSNNWEKKKKDSLQSQQTSMMSQEDRSWQFGVYAS